MKKLMTIFSPKHCYAYATFAQPWLFGITFFLLAVGVTWGLIFAPPDYQQGHAFRIIYLHVPAAAMSLAIYTAVAFFSALHLIWRVKVADIAAKASVPIGISFTCLALVTGAIWGKPMWGTFWIWDARLTSELILLFLYLGIYALRASIPDREKAAKAAAILSLIGLVDLPIIHYSVYWWQTLHQGATLFKLARPSIAPEMLYPLLVMLVACGCYYLSILCLRVRNEILTSRETG